MELWYRVLEALLYLFLALSPQVTVYIAWVLAKNIQVWNQDSLWSQGGADYTASPFPEHVVVQGFRSSSVPVTHEGYLVESRRPLWFGSSQANYSVFNTLSRHYPLAAVSRSTSIITLCLGSSASLSSPFSSSCYVGSHCSAFLSC